MTTPRHMLVDPENERDYHLVSRCVRRAFLCGVDEFTKRNCSHRRQWLVERLKQLAPCFAVDIYGYTVLSNHFHVVLRHDPLAWRGWSDEEVVQRWFDAFPPTERGKVVEARKPELRELMLGDPKRLARARRTLGSLSNFMKHLKQPIARRANLEDDCTGHFFEQRFYSGALLTEEALIAAMVYVDLNPVRAEMAERIEEIRETSICDRLQINSPEALEEYLRPVVSGLDTRHAASDSSSGAAMMVESPGGAMTLATGQVGASSQNEPDGDPTVGAEEHECDDRDAGSDADAAKVPPEREPGREGEHERPTRRPCPSITLADYIELVRAIIVAETAPSRRAPDPVLRWLARTKVLRKRQRAYGTERALRSWIADRGLQLREIPLPC